MSPWPRDPPAQRGMVMANGDIRRPAAGKGSGIAALLIVLGIAIMVATAIACVAYGVTKMQPGMDPAEKAALKSTVRLMGTIPMLAGLGLLVVGILKRRAPKPPPG